MVVHRVLKTVSPPGNVSLGTIFQVLEFLSVAVTVSPEQPQILLIYMLYHYLLLYICCIIAFCLK